MKPVEIAISRSVRVNTGNYEGTDLFVSMKSEVDEWDDPEEVRRKLKARVAQAILEDLQDHYRARGQEDRMTPEVIRRRHGI